MWGDLWIVYLVTGTGKAWAAQKRFSAAKFEYNNDVLVAAVEKRGLTLPLGSIFPDI